MLKISDEHKAVCVKECQEVEGRKICPDLKSPATDMDERSFIMSITGSDFLAYREIILQ